MCMGDSSRVWDIPRASLPCRAPTEWKLAKKKPALLTRPMVSRRGGGRAKSFTGLLFPPMSRCYASPQFASTMRSERHNYQGLWVSITINAMCVLPQRPTCSQGSLLVSSARPGSVPGQTIGRRLGGSTSYHRRFWEPNEGGRSLETDAGQISAHARADDDGGVQLPRQAGGEDQGCIQERSGLHSARLKDEPTCHGTLRCAASPTWLASVPLPSLCWQQLHFLTPLLWTIRTPVRPSHSLKRNKMPRRQARRRASSSFATL